MKKLTFQKQIIVIFLISISFTIVFSFFFLHHLYTNLYLTSIKESIIYQGKQTTELYHYGELSEEIVDKIEWYNIISEYEIIVVDQLENLTTYFPYQIDYEALVDEQDIEVLAQGKYVLKEGYVAELNREIIGAIFPIKGAEELIGYIYIYVPLENIEDVFKDSLPILIFAGTIFFLILFVVIHLIWRSIYRPLKNLQELAYEVSSGNYTRQLPIERDDEIGQLTEAFNEMSKSLLEQEERKKEFTSNVVHELRTPLSYIRGYVDVLKEKIKTAPEEAETYLATIAKETERMSKLINDLVELNHLEEDLYKLTKEPIVISQLLLDTLDLFDIHLEKKQLSLDLHVDETLIVSGDAKRIHQVFYNTLDNAIKYAAEGSTLTLTLKKVKNYAEYSLNNIGVTIDKADLKRIGERFFRTDRARTKTTGGTGLGLSIVKEIVRLHEGTFSITSNEVDGTTVTISFPLLDLESEALS